MANRYMAFDIETIVDWELLYNSEHKFGEKTDTCIARVKNELCNKQGLSEFSEPWIPERYHAPVCVAFIGLDENGSYKTHKVIGDTHSGWVTREFWGLLQDLPADTLVSFNGKHYDIPVMELNGFRHGALMDRWFMLHAKYASDNPRAKYNDNAHLDLYQLLKDGNNLGGTMDYWASLMGLPGKVCMSGASVADEMKKGTEGLKMVMDYCMADVLSTVGMLIHILHCSGDLPVLRHPIKPYGPLIDGILAKIEPTGVEQGCIKVWAADYRAKVANSKTAEALADDDYIPF